MVLMAVAAVPAAAPGDTAALVDSSTQIAARIIGSKVPVIVDFWAPWCKPCLMVSPALAQIARQYKGKARLMKVNIDVHRRISAYFGVTSIPAVYIVRNKIVRATLQGARTKEEYQKALEEVLAMKDEPADTAAAASRTPQPAGGAKKDTAAGETKEE